MNCRNIPYLHLLSPEGVIGMRTAIRSGSVITLREIGTDNEHKFTISDTIGVGASCIVYSAVHRDAEGNEIKTRLKEFYPESLDIRRCPDNSLDIENVSFSRALKRFTDGYQKQLAFRDIPESMNSISNIQGIFEGNNTKYIAMSCQNGISIDEAELSLYDIFRLMRAITLQIDNFHKNGYLYLDLKPENVILYPETPELVMLFDFDSAIRADEVAAENVSFTRKWSAPEIIQRNVRKIGIQSDIYSLGALFMYMVFRRSPGLFDRRRSADWNSEFENSILADESPEIRRTVTEIFRNTLSAEPGRRFSSCGELLEIIGQLIQSFRKQRPYLQTVLPVNNNYFCGREREINTIHEMLECSNILVLHGIGGIGKTELARHYAQKYADEYDAVVFVRYSGSIIETFADDIKFPVAELERGDDENDEEYFARKISVLQKICTPRHLIILDNFDTDECDDLDGLLALQCRYLITSRVDFEDIFPQLEVDILDEMDDIRGIFTHYSKLENDEYSDRIIIALEGHTMAVELVSKQMKMNGASSQEMYDKLCENGISADENKIRNFKDGSLRNKTAAAHIEVLFNVFGLSDDVKQILRNASLLGPNPVDTDWFSQLCGLDEQGRISLDKAVSGGWIQRYDDTLQLHSLIAEVLYRQLSPDPIMCRTLLENLITVTENLDAFQGDMRRAHIAYLRHAAAKITGADDLAARFLENAATYVYAYEHDYPQAAKISLKLLDILQGSENADSSRINSAMLMVTAYSRYSGDVETARKYEELLLLSGISREFISTEFLVALNGNRTDDARFYAEELLRISETSHDYFDSYRCLYMAESMNGNTEKAAGYASCELEYLRKYLNENLHETDTEKLSEMYSAAGDACRDCCKFDDAIGYYTRSLELAESILGEKHIATADLYFNTGLCYVRSGETEKGISLAKTSCSIVSEHYGDIHLETAEYLDMLADLCNAAYEISGKARFRHRVCELHEKAEYIRNEISENRQ